MSPDSDQPVQNFVADCRWLIRPGELPLEFVRISVSEGILTEVCAVPPAARHRVLPLAVLPGFVNAHTHLEFSDLAEPLGPPTAFTEWIGSVLRWRLQRDAGSAVEHAVLQGVRESTHGGVRLLGEICTSPAGHEVLQSACRAPQTVAVSFRELIGLKRDRAEESLRLAADHLRLSSPSVRTGLSPHAPYTVCEDLFAAAVDLATQHAVPLAMHIAETRDEMELLSQQTGAFVTLLRSLNLWDPSVFPMGATPLRYVEQLVRLPRALVVHGNYLQRPEIAFLSRHPHIAVVYCPRTAAYFGHRHHPWKQLRDAGATVILGTDSRASNPDLAVWRELQYVARSVDEPLWDLLPMITSMAAAALGADSAEYQLRVGYPWRGCFIHACADSPAALNTELKAARTLPQNQLPQRADQ